MIKKHTEVYYSNTFGGRFSSEAEAIADENHRITSPFKVAQTQVHFYKIQGEGIEALNDFGHPWTGQVGNRSIVYLFKNMIPKMQEMINKYGDNVGYCHQHHGMGNYIDMVVLLEENNATSS